jgi:hypothetical protein
MYLYVYNSTITNVRKEVFIMGKEEYYDRGKYADMLTGNLDKICEIASKTANGTTLPYALMGYTPEQCAMAEQFVDNIRKAKAAQDEAEFKARVEAAAAKFRKQKYANQFFKRHSRNAANQIEIDKQTIEMLGSLWKANLNPEIITSNEFDGLDVPTDIVLGGTIALDDVEIEFPVYLDCATGDAYGYVMNDNRAKVAKARFIMRPDYIKRIMESDEQQVAFCDVHLSLMGTNSGGKRYEFIMGTELMIRKDMPACIFYNDEYAIKGNHPGKIMAFMAERILVYYTAIWYSIMLAYLHPLTITSIVDVGKKMMEQYSHEPTKYKAPLKNIRYLKMDGKTLEKVLYHSKPGKGKKYERHCQLWYVRGYMRKGKWIAPQWRGPLAKMKRLSDDIEARQRKIVGVSIDKK